MGVLFSIPQIDIYEDRILHFFRQKKQATVSDRLTHHPFSLPSCISHGLPCRRECAAVLY
jgi:hypothetical protein